MNDAISTIALGVDTKPGLEHLKELRAAFAGLRSDITEFNALRTNPQSMGGDGGKAKNELATLSAALKQAQGELAQMQAQMQASSKSNVAAVEASNKAIVKSTMDKNRGVIESERAQAAETLKLAKDTTKGLEDEAKKRASMSQSAKLGSTSYSLKSPVSQSDAEGKILQDMLRRQAAIVEGNALKRLATERASEAEHRSGVLSSMVKDEATIQKLLDAHAAYQSKKAAHEREGQLQHEQLMLASAMKDEAAIQKLLTDHAAFQAKKAAIEREGQMLHQQIMLESSIKDETAIQRMLADHAAFQAKKAGIEREGQTLHQQMLLESTLKDEGTLQKMLADHAAFQAKKAAVEQEGKLLHQQMLLESTLKDEASLQKLLAEHAAFQVKKAELEKAGESLHRQMILESAIKDAASIEARLAAEKKAAEEKAKLDLKNSERQAILNSRFQDSSPQQRMSTIRGANTLTAKGGEDLATRRYGSDAVAAAKNFSGALNLVESGENRVTAAQLRNHGVMQETAARHKVVRDAMNDAHSAARGLAGGLGQLWVTWGNTVPLVAGAMITGSMAKTFTAGKEMEFQLQFLRALSDEVNSSPIDMDKFLHITDGTMATVKEAAEGMRALAQAGLNQKQALTALPDILDLAAIGEMKVGQAALTATGVVNAFGLAMTDIGRVGDVFARVASASNTSVAGMTESMKQASTVGELFGMTLEETSSAIGVLAQRNILGASAGTALTTALKNLYEPTAMAKKALDAMKISTDNGVGGLRSVSDMMVELREKVTALNDSDQAVFLGKISDQRGAKAFSAIINNLDEYFDFLKKTTGAANFMSEGTLKLEDTVEGSMRRMGNTMESTFIKGFKDAEPAIRGVVHEMTNLAKSEGLVSLVSSLALSMTRFTATVVDHSGKIMIAVAAYAGLKIVSSLSNAYVRWRTDTAMATLSLAANTTASASNTTALTIQQQAANAAGLSMTRLAVASRMAAAAFGPLTLVIMATYAAYEFLAANVEKSANQQQRVLNTGDTIIDYYQRQTDKLKELNAELREKNDLELRAAGGIPEIKLNDVQKEMNAVNELIISLTKKQSLETKQGKVATINANAFMPAGAGQATKQDDTAGLLEQAMRRRAAIQQKLTDIEGKKDGYDKGYKENETLKGRSRVVSDLKRLIDDAGGDELYKGGTEASRALVPELKDLLKKAAGDESSFKDIAPTIQEWRDKVNASKGKLPVKPKNAGDLYRAGQKEFDGELEGIRRVEKTQLSDTKSLLNRNEIGDLMAIERNLQTVKKARQDEYDVFVKKENYAASQEKRKADVVSMNNKQAEMQYQIVEAEREAERQRGQIRETWAQDSLRSEAETLRKRGDLVGAFQKEFDAKYGGERKKLGEDLKSTTFDEGTLAGLSSRKSYLEDEEKTGKNSARFNELSAKYEEIVANMESKLADAAQKASSTNGFLSDVGAAQETDAILAEMIPKAEKVRQEMIGVAEALNDPKLKGNVSKLGTELVKDAQRSTKAWVDAGKSIEKALSDAFGKGGKAVGGVISALMRQKAEQKDINEELKRSQDKPENATKLIELETAARQKSAELQISSLGSVAGAAKGFFDEQSKGYAALEAAEKAFRMVETVMAINNFAIKQGFMKADLMTHLFGTQAKAAADTTDTGKVLIEEGIKQKAKGVTAVVNQASGGDPYTAWARMAMMVAAIAALGVMVGGAGGGAGGASKVDLAKERQNVQGTGFQYDAANPENNAYEWELKKSESLDKSLEALRDNSEMELRYSSSQLLALESINTGISGLANMVSITAGIRGTKADEKALGVYATHSKLGFSSSSTSLLDSGIRFANTDIGSILNGGGVAQSYAELETKKKSFWGLSSSKNTSTQTQNLDASFAEQMSLIVTDMFSMVKDASASFGMDIVTVEQALKSVNLSAAGLTQISLKGLSAEEVDKELQAVFGQLGDTMAKIAMPGLEAFQKAGEGYMTTTVRVSTGIEAAAYTMQKLGIETVKYTDVLNKQGDISTEIVRASLLHKEATGTVLSGIGDMVKTFNGSASEMAEAYTKLNNVRRTMMGTGAKNADVTADMVKGAGGIDNLSSGMESFLENFFSEGERAAIKAEMLDAEFKKLNVAMPASKDAMKDLIQGTDRTTVAGQTLYGALINLSGQFSDMADDAGNLDPALARQRAAVLSLVDVAERWLDAANTGRDLLRDLDAELSGGTSVDNSKRIADLREMMGGTVSFEQQLELAGKIKDLVLERYEIEKKNAEELIEFGQNLKDFVKDLRTGERSPLTNREKLAEAQTLYQNTIKDLSSSDVTVRDKARDSIQDRADNLLELAKTYYASSDGYTSIFNTVAQELEALGVAANQKGVESIAKDQLRELKDLRDTVAGINTQVEVELQIATKQLAVQLRVMEEMSRSLGVISEVPGILRGLPAELAAVMGVQGGVSGVGINAGAGDGVRDLYRQLFDREADVGGLDFWINAMKTQGATLDDIRKAMLNSDEYKLKINGSHASGLDYVPFDGYVAELHRGERVLTATEARRTDKTAMTSTESFSSTEREEMAAEIRELKGTLEKISVHMIEAMHSSTINAADKTVAGMREAMPTSQEKPKAKII